MISTADSLMGIFGFHRVSRQMTTDQTLKVMAYNTALRSNDEARIQKAKEDLVEEFGSVHETAVFTKNEHNTKLHDNIDDVSVQK